MGTVAKLSSVLDVTPSADETMLPILEKQRAAFLKDGPPSLETRLARIAKLKAVVLKYKDEMGEALNSDFGNRSKLETKLAEVMSTITAINHTTKMLPKWMKPKKRPVTQLSYPLAKSKIIYQPLGVIGIMAPWNYPIYLALSPLVEALAAGNRVMIKPSELTPKTSDLIKTMLADAFDESEVAVLLGGPEVGAAFSGLPFDHLLYTGSTHVGRLVMKAAADKMVPVTLELGGKSPTIIGEDFDMEKAIDSIAMGKLLNAGQTCIAPDYIFVPDGRREEFVEGFRKRASEMYPSLADNADYTSIISDSHYERITRLVQDAVEKGAKVVQSNPKDEQLQGARKIAPTLVLDVTEDMDIMQEEIFGPVMPVMTYKSIDDAINYVNSHPRPLALYYFSDDAAKADKVMNCTTSGGACINEVVFHVAQEELPFGGVGPSGCGAYHGQCGFETFSHAKGVFYQSKLAAWAASKMLRPPFTEKTMKLISSKIK